ncbi:hypothetical protein LTR08_006092 [Meristemomyces frigidus]|nr:hypothetical protein LTR08_006092 [Meristemomyces frigidus]
MPPRPAHDPFTEAPLRPTNGNPALRAQTSQQTLRPSASAATARTRQQRDLFAPSLSRRPISRNTPHVEDGVLADPDSEEEMAGQRQRHMMRRVRQGSPEGKQSRPKPKQEEELDIVNRQANGSYLLGISASNEGVAPQQLSEEMQMEQEAAEMDEEDITTARSYFTSGAGMSGRSSKKSDEEYDAVAPAMMIRMREVAMQKIEKDRWLFEKMDRYQTRLA